jgi:hypothetical protein
MTNSASNDPPARPAQRRADADVRPRRVLIDLPHYEVEERVAATAKALAAGAPAVYEASFLADDILVSVDILERHKRGFVLTEVKSTTKLKKQHLPDVAVQIHVARRAGLGSTAPR